MDHSSTFTKFLDDIKLDGIERYEEELKGVAKKLNQKYYDSDSETAHRIIVGSVGRSTAVEGTSDVDMLFVLPKSIFKRFDEREGNGQSALLQEVKNTLKEKYPKTDMKGDGQAVVINFTNRDYTIDLIPAFEQADGSFKYPNSHNGGSWKRTDPIPEQDAAKKDANSSSGNFIHYCNILRIWRNNIGFGFGGLLIDTLVHNHLDDGNLKYALSKDFYESFKFLLGKLREEDAEQSYWLALGSNQQVKNADNGTFVRKAKKGYKKLDEAITELEKEDALIELLGKRFEECIVESERATQEQNWRELYGSTDTEEFIEDRFPLEARYELAIDCDVTQDGWRPRKLSQMIREKTFLRKDKTLTFKIVGCKVPKPYSIYWKVRNVGRIAHKENQIRGQIEPDAGQKERIEHTRFSGPHFVECYIVKDGKCVARDRISVAIKAE